MAAILSASDARAPLPPPCLRFPFDNILTLRSISRLQNNSDETEAISELFTELHSQLQSTKFRARLSLSYQACGSGTKQWPNMLKVDFQARVRVVQKSENVE